MTPCLPQIVQPAAVAPVLLAGRFVLVGDPAQLPPVIQSPAARRRGMDQCLFSRLAAGDANTVQLTVQYRMNGTLTAAANHLTYEGRLSCGSEAVDAATMQRLPTRVGGGGRVRGRVFYVILSPWSPTVFISLAAAFSATNHLCCVRHSALSYGLDSCYSDGLDLLLLDTNSLTSDSPCPTG